jgi:hypothetical protein
MSMIAYTCYNMYNYENSKDRLIIKQDYAFNYNLEKN